MKLLMKIRIKQMKVMVNKPVVYGANEQLKTRFVKQTIKVSVPEACHEAISAHEAEGP